MTGPTGPQPATPAPRRGMPADIGSNFEPKVDPETGEVILPPWHGAMVYTNEEAEAEFLRNEVDPNDVEEREREEVMTQRAQSTLPQVQKQLDAMARGDAPVMVDLRSGAPNLGLVRELERRQRALADAESFPDPTSFVPGDVFEAEPDVEPEWWMSDGMFTVGTSAEDADVATLITVTGGAGSGKSTLVGDLVRCACDGEPWGGEMFGSQIRLPDGGTVLWSNLEMSRSLLRTRFLRPLGIKNKSRYVPMTLPVPVPVMTEDGRAWWINALSYQRTHTWVVDSYSILTSVENENDNAQNTRAIQRVREIATEAGVKVVVLIDHTGWVATDRMRGASSKKDRIDEMFSYELVDPEDLAGLRTLRHVKSRWSDGGTTAHVTWDRETRRHTFTPGTKAEAAALAREEKEAARKAEAEAEHERQRSVLIDLVADRIAYGLPPIRNSKELRSLLAMGMEPAMDLRKELLDGGLLLPVNGCVANLDNDEMSEAIASARAKAEDARRMHDG